MITALTLFPLVLAFFGRGAAVEEPLVRGGHIAGAVRSCPTCTVIEDVVPEEAQESMRVLHEHGIGFLTAEKLYGRLRSGSPPILINALSADAYKESHIKGSINIPYDEVESLAPKIIPDLNAEIVVYCGSYMCNASVKAAQAFKQLGYTNVSDFKGGMKEWQKGKLRSEVPASLVKRIRPEGRIYGIGSACCNAKGGASPIFCPGDATG